MTKTQRTIGARHSTMPDPAEVARPEEFLERLDRNESDAVCHLRRKLGEICFVPLGQDEFLDAMLPRREPLLANAADWQDETAQRDLSGHRHALAHGLIPERRHNREDQVVVWGG